MSHELSIKNNKAEMAFAGEVPWHGLGVAVANDLSAQEMLVAAHLDWEVEKHPVRAVRGDKIIETGHDAMIRSDDLSVLDVVPSSWAPIQNKSAFEFFEGIVARGDATMETAGALYGGQCVWGLAKLKDAQDILVGDPTECFLLLTNNHRYGWSITTHLTPIRVVCHNTLTAAIQGATQNAVVKFAHNGSFDPDLAQRALAATSERFAAYCEQAKFLAKCRAPVDQVSEFLKKIFPATGEDKTIPSLPAVRAQQALATMPGADLGEGTWWAAFNACTFTVDHLLGQTRESALKSAWYGPGADKKRKAFNLALEYAEAA